MFERQARGAEIEKNEWANQLLSLLPLDISQIVLRESEEDCKDYEAVKKLLLGRFKLSPEAFRVKFSQHMRRADNRWKDYAYELKNYLEGWVEGLGIKDFESLKDLMLTEQDRSGRKESFLRPIRDIDFPV